jgi:hypothetical protein
MSGIYPVPKFIQRFEQAVEKRWLNRWDRQGTERVDRHFRAVGIDPVAKRHELDRTYGKPPNAGYCCEDCRRREAQ